MNFHKLLRFLLVTLIALQSVGATAEASQDHETGAGQFELVYDHSSEQQLDSHADSVPDCHHCFHYPILMAEAENASGVMLFRSPTGQNIPFYFSQPLSPDLRPPII